MKALKAVLSLILVLAMAFCFYAPIYAYQGIIEISLV